MTDKLRALASPNLVTNGSTRAVVTQAAAAGSKKKQRRHAGEMLRRGEIEWSPDLARVLALPRRTKPDLQQLSTWMTERLKKPAGTMHLWAVQAWVLWEFPQMGGGVGFLQVGAGKTLPGMLMPMVMPGCQRAVLLIPPSLRDQFQADWEEYSKHWVLPNLAGSDRFVAGRPVLHVLAYSEVQRTDASDIIESIRPDLIIADEAHNLRYRDRARTRRFLRYFVQYPETRFCGWSGTLTDTTIRDYAHLAALALSEGSPLPLVPEVVDDWAQALDADAGNFIDPGVLRKLCMPTEEPRIGFRRRLRDTPGVVCTEESILPTKLIFHERQAPAVPLHLVEAMKKVRRPPNAGGWMRPDEEVLTDMLRVNACLVQLALGFYLRWRFPNDEPRELKDEWFNRRQAYNRELRAKLTNSRKWLDSEALCEQAAKRWFFGGCTGCKRGSMEPHARGCEDVERQPLWNSDTWLPWVDIEPKVVHELQAVWIDDYLLHDAAAWAKEKPGIVWVAHPTVGHRLAQISGMPYFGKGDAASVAIRKEDGKRSIIASINAHRDGKNLQGAFWRNLLLPFPPSNGRAEQTLGRTHRPHQPSDVVEAHLYRHTPELAESIDKAREKARYVFETTGAAQKLCYGQFTW